MKIQIALFVIAIAMSTGCSKKSQPLKQDNSTFTFRTQKNGNYWAVNGVTASYNTKDSMMHISAYGEKNERFSLSFFKKPKYVGKWQPYYAGVAVPSCEHCASIAQLYSLDTLKKNSFEIMGFDDIDNRILGRFSFHLKKDSIYPGAFIKDSSLYEGVFSVPYETVAF